jgi:hypothetical protein
VTDEPETDADPQDYEPAGRELAPTVASDPVDMFRVLDSHDEKQILAELQGKVLDKTLYDFGTGKDRKVDLSYSGVRECVHEMNRTGKCKIGLVLGSLEVTEVVEDGQPHYIADVWARDEATGTVFVGTANQPKRMQLRKSTAAEWRKKGKVVDEDDKVWDPFARTKAVNKAARNSLGMFVPEVIRQTLIAQYLSDPKRVQVIGLGSESDLEELPPPIDTPEMKEKVTKARDLFSQITDIAPGGVAVKLTPASFHRYLIRGETDHDRMDGFLALLAEKLEAAKSEAES